MTPEKAKVLLAWMPYLEAIKDGKSIQCRDTGADWRDYTLLVNDDLHQGGGPFYKPESWRIKPEPREFVIRIESNRDRTFWQIDPRDAVPVSEDPSIQIIHVREVLPE